MVKLDDSLDCKALSDEEAVELCGLLRGKMIETVAETGGHLASGLGAVELTVAVHRVFDLSKDRLVFDVGHQCYSHKLLTGRTGGLSYTSQLWRDLRLSQTLGEPD